MSLSICTKEVAGAVLLEMKGRITLGYDSVFRDQIEALIAAKHNRVILDISQISYIDSSGLGALVSALTAVRNAAGRLTVCYPGIKFMDLMHITKLMIAFDVVASMEEALTQVKSDQLRFCCPVSGCVAWSLLKTAADAYYQTCARCRSETRLTLKGGEKSTSSVSIEHVRIPTYQGEYALAVPGTPRCIEVVGRLDLFAFNALRKASSTLGPAVFDLTHAEEISEQAIRSLRRLLPATDSVVFVPDKKRFPSGMILVYSDRPEAVTAHFAAIKSTAKRRGINPTYGGSLHTYLLT